MSRPLERRPSVRLSQQRLLRTIKGSRSFLPEGINEPLSPCAAKQESLRVSTLELSSTTHQD